MADGKAIGRSALVTSVAWIVMVASALVVPVSVISLLMLVAGGDGTRNATLSGAFVVIVLPPLATLAGFGLRRRWRSAYLFILLLLAGMAAWNALQMVRGPTPARTEVSPDGVATHVLASSVDYPVHGAALLVSLAVLAALLSRPVRAEFAHRPARGGDPRTAAKSWRVGHQGRDEMYYEELHDGRWERLRIGGEMLTGHAHHVIYFASAQEWLAYPAWARGRRDEIVDRVKSEFRAPDYEYHGDGPGAPAARLARPAPPVAAHRGAPAGTAAGSVTRSQRNALLIAIALLLAVAGAMTWLVQSGVASGETWSPTRRATERRVVARADEPAMFWVSIGVYAMVGAGSLGLATWGIREGLRLQGR